MDFVLDYKLDFKLRKYIKACLNTLKKKTQVFFLEICLTI